MSLTKESIFYEEEYGEARQQEAGAYYLQNISRLRNYARAVREANEERKEGDSGNPRKTPQNNK